MKQILISGSSAYDNIHHFDGEFDSMTQKELMHMSVITSSYVKNHWGTGANIAYNLSLLGESAILLSSIWDDYTFSPVISEKINLKYIHQEEWVHTASSVIIADNSDNRMTFFHPWAMNYASMSKIGYVQESCSIAMISANYIPTMIEHARQCKDQKLPIFIDPAQQVSQMTQQELLDFLDAGTYLIANHLEFSEIIDTSDISENEIINKFEIVIITYWADWLKLYQNWELTHIPAIQVDDFDDSTWAWDALRAWILYWMTEGLDVQTACKLWTILASYCILAPWSQQHHFWLWNVMEDMKNHFDIEIDLFSKRKY